MNTGKKVYCGIDVSKKNLDAFIQGKTMRFANTVKGVDQLLKNAGSLHYVFESTGGYERLAAWRLLEAGQTVSIVNPGRVREFAKSIGQIAKTDRIDAQVISRFAELTCPRETRLPNEDQRRLTVLVERRQQLVEMRNAESNRLETAGEPEARKMIQKHCRWIEKQIASIEQAIDSTIKKNDQMHLKAQRVRRIEGLGPVCASTLLAVIPEIGTLSRKEAAALAGVAPYNRDSGTFRGRRHICGGRKRLRACLYMAAVCASLHNPHLKRFYHRLVKENHCPKKVALTAVMRKLIIAANSVVKNPDFLLAS